MLSKVVAKRFGSICESSKRLVRSIFLSPGCRQSRLVQASLGKGKSFSLEVLFPQATDCGEDNEFLHKGRSHPEAFSIASAIAGGAGT